MTLYFVEQDDDSTAKLVESIFITSILPLLVLRGNGYKFNSNLVKSFRGHVNAIYTNDETLLNCPDFWNKETQRHDIYFWRNDKWVLLQDLTIKELRQPHNLTHLYMAGEFDED